MADQTEKPKLGTRPPLGIKRTVETGKVKQSFSHGRSNTVVVERKQRRVFTKPGEAPPPAPEPVAETPPPAPAPKPVAPAAPQPRRPSATEEIANRKEMQTRLLREAEEARMTALEDARRREEQAKSRPTRKSVAEPRSIVAPKRQPPRKPLAELRKRRLPQLHLRRPEDAEPAAVSVPEETEERSFRRPGHAPAPKRPEPSRPTRGREDRRHSGKLTVSRALSDEDESRARSLAALRRAREKEKRHHMETGPAPSRSGT